MRHDRITALQWVAIMLVCVGMLLVPDHQRLSGESLLAAVLLVWLDRSL